MIFTATYVKNLSVLSIIQKELMNISLIANSLYLYLATLTQLYLFLCYKMNTQRTRPDQHSAVKVALDVN